MAAVSNVRMSRIIEYGEIWTVVWCCLWMLCRTFRIRVTLNVAAFAFYEYDTKIPIAFCLWLPTAGKGRENFDLRAKNPSIFPDVTIIAFFLNYRRPRVNAYTLLFRYCASRGLINTFFLIRNMYFILLSILDFRKCFHLCKKFKHRLIYIMNRRNCQKFSFGYLH